MKGQIGLKGKGRRTMGKGVEEEGGRGKEGEECPEDIKRGGEVEQEGERADLRKTKR